MGNEERMQNGEGRRAGNPDEVEEFCASLKEIIMGISTRFLGLESREIPGEVQQALRRMGEILSCERVFLGLFAATETKFRSMDEWCVAGVGPRFSHPASLESFPEISGALARSDWGALSAEEKNELLKQKSPLQNGGRNLLIPICYGKSSVGLLGFDAVPGERVASPRVHDLLRIFGEILIHILERRQAVEDLNEEREKYRSLVENINDAIFTMDDQGRFTYVSPVVKDLIAYAAEELIGHPLARFVHLEDLPDFLESVKRSLAGRLESFDFRVFDKKGNVRHLRISSRPLTRDERLLGLTGILSDVTEQKWAELLLRRAEKKYRSIFENTVEGIFQRTPQGHFIVSNPACARILGYASTEDLITRSLSPDYRYYVEPQRGREFHALLREQGLVQGFEYEVYRKDGSKIWISENSIAIRDAGGKLLFCEGVLQDITERKLAEAEILYLSFHDKLTGLYNRAYFEEELKRLDTQRQLPISIVMGDVNGLKLINDAFGHLEGDKLLARIGSILRESCRKEDVVARLGGDEFAISLLRTSPQATMEVTDRIKAACQNYSRGTLKLSIALGAATKEEASKKIQEVMKEAEDRMYRNKMLESKSIRSSILASLRRTLFEKSHETEEHTMRIQRLALPMGRILGLPDGELDELALLAALHDIGKVAIPEEIIVKPADLSPEEWQIIQKHPEIGFRIAGSSPELAPIAEAILAHHEWWNGTGYPRKLKGKEIPLISRIISVVDAYDVITNGRPYKKKLSREAALEELRRNAGTQFDPELIEMFFKIVSGRQDPHVNPGAEIYNLAGAGETLERSTARG